ncbi:PqqD family protein [Halosimplex salinum]|uniref:PqqD family protein n=1 Tax=Halosimplex salinum TaxID=1710538 RepID=UPI000F488C4D|nr:PqqD family protein [Halosimplex salinum]
MERSETVLATTVDGEAVMLETESGTYYGFNETATFVWERLETAATVSELREAILSRYDVDREQCERDLEDTLAEMAEHGLVEVDSDI